MMYSKGIIGAIFNEEEQIGLLMNWECNFQKFSFEVRARAYWFEKQIELNKEYTVHLYLDRSKSRRRYEGCILFCEEVDVGSKIINKTFEIKGLGQIKYLEE